MKNADIPKAGLLIQIVKEYRDEFVGSLQAEMQPLAGKDFDEYLAAGGLCSEEDMPQLKFIVEDNFSEEDRLDLLKQCAVEETIDYVQRKIAKAVKVREMQPLPRKGNASAKKEKRLRRETEQEERELRAFRSSLRPARLPPEMVQTAEAPARSGVTLLSTISWPPEAEGKKQAWTRR